MTSAMAADGVLTCARALTPLLDRIDDYESDTSKFTAQDFEHVEKECYYCKLCYNHCPYSPPHDYAIDFPRLMAAWKKQRVSEGGATWRDKLTGPNRFHWPTWQLYGSLDQLGAEHTVDSRAGGTIYWHPQGSPNFAF